MVVKLSHAAPLTVLSIYLLILLISSLTQLCSLEALCFVFFLTFILGQWHYCFFRIIGFTSLDSSCVFLLFNCLWMLPTPVSSWVTSRTSWGSIKAEYRPWWWRYRWGSSRAVMFLTELSIWRRLWLERFTCRNIEKRSVLKRFIKTERSKNNI